MATQKKIIRGFSETTVGKNIAYEMKKYPKQSRAQDIAIALNVARDAAKKADRPALVRKYTQKKK